MASRIVVFFIFFALFTSEGRSTEWFFRPKDGGPYGTSDGRSYANAWHLDDSALDERGNPLSGAVDWSKIKAGDTLYVCGFHDGGPRDYRLIPTVSGSPDQPIVINGKCPKSPSANHPDEYDSGILFAAGKKIVVGWRGPDDFGVYSIPYRGSTGSQVIEDATRRLERQSRLPDGSWQPASFYQEGPGAILYYRPSEGAATDHTLYTVAASAISLKGVKNIHIKNLAVRNVSGSSGLIEIDNSHRIHVESCDLRWAAHTAVRVKNNSDHGRLVGNRIYDVANGIGLGAVRSAENNDDWLIAENEIYRVDQEFYYRNIDSHAISVQGGSHNVIERNHLHDIGGSGITFYTYPHAHQIQQHNIVRYNFVHDVQDRGDGKRNERGIEANNDGGAEGIQGNMIYYNIIANVLQIGLRSKSGKSASGFAWSLFNNVVYNAGTSFSWNEYPPGDPGFELRNNIFVNPTSLHIKQAAYQGGDDHSGIVMTNNVYWSEGSTGDRKFQWAGRAYKKFGAWQKASGKGQGSFVADPRFVSSDPVKPEDFQLRIRSGEGASPCIDAGIGVHLSRDYFGNPVGSKPDIGVHEGRNP